MSIVVKPVDPPPLFSDKDIPTVYQEWFRKMWVAVNGPWTSFTPTGNLTVVGTATYTGTYKVLGHVCKFQIEASSTITLATTAGTSYFDFPVSLTSSTGKSGLVVMMDKTTNVAVGTGVIDYTNNRIYLPTQAASGNTFGIYGEYEI